MYFLKVTIKSFDVFFLIKTIYKIKSLCKVFKVKDIKTYCLPSTIKKYTVERSPHIDKKSREQFERKKFKTKIELPLQNKRIAECFEVFFKNSIHPGVEISISSKFCDYLPISYKNKS